MLGPIFVREWQLLPRRPQHYALRAAYLGLLLVLGGTSWLATFGWARPATLGDTARFGQLLFRLLVVAQLVVLLFFAALSAAGSIAQEKDRRTFLLLLLTDLRAYEIVLGKLLGSLLTLGVLLLGAVPVLALNVLLGGVTFSQVGQAFLVLSATSLAAGALGCMLALWRDQTFPALALTVLCLVLYFCVVRSLALVPGELGQLAWWLDPTLCLESVLVPELATAVVPPALGYALAMLGLSGLLTGWGMLRLRRWNPRGEPLVRGDQPDDKDEKERHQAHAAPGSARPVWSNPILWREVRTRAYGRRPLLVKLAYLLVVGVLGWYNLAPDLRVPFAIAYGLLPVAILGLLLVGLQAVTAITSERDLGALDLLLATDLSPREFIFGKLGGVCWNSKEVLLPPLLLAGYYASQGLLTVPQVVCLLVTYGVLVGFVTVLGVHIGLRTPLSRTAIVHTLGTVFFLSAGTLSCLYLILISGRFEYQWGSFVFFLVAGIGGLWWVLNGEQPSQALGLASLLCPLAVLYAVMNVAIGKPGVAGASPPYLPALVLVGAFGFTIWAMLMPLLSEFDVALGRTTGPNE